MALSDLSVFSEYAYLALTEVITQQIEKFNAASRNTIVLVPSAHQGDYDDKAFFAKISGLVRRRNAYGSGAVAGKKLQHLVDTMVKVASGTPPVEIDPGQFKWIQMNPQVAGAAIGQQLALDMLADMLNTAIMGGYAALSQITGTSGIVTDVTGLSPDTCTPVNLNSAAAKFGDRAQDLLAWVMHSTPMHSYHGYALTNAQNLFTYGTVAVMQDAFGRVFIVTDSPSLHSGATPDVYHILGLVANAIRVDQNNDFTDNIETSNGDENILRTYQAEWTYNLGIKGFAWDKSHGSHSPNDAAIAVTTNWDRYATSVKDLAGVVMECN
jgi:hypothetical protein